MKFLKTVCAFSCGVFAAGAVAEGNANFLELSAQEDQFNFDTSLDDLNRKYMADPNFLWTEIRMKDDTSTLHKEYTGKDPGQVSFTEKTFIDKVTKAEGKGQARSELAKGDEAFSKGEPKTKSAFNSIPKVAQRLEIINLLKEAKEAKVYKQAEMGMLTQYKDALKGAGFNEGVPDNLNNEANISDFLTVAKHYGLDLQNYADTKTAVSENTKEQIQIVIKQVCPLAKTEPSLGFPKFDSEGCTADGKENEKTIDQNLDDIKRQIKAFQEAGISGFREEDQGHIAKKAGLQSAIQNFLAKDKEGTTLTQKLNAMARPDRRYHMQKHFETAGKHISEVGKQQLDEVKRAMDELKSQIVTHLDDLKKIVLEIQAAQSKKTEPSTSSTAPKTTAAKTDEAQPCCGKKADDAKKKTSVSFAI